MEKLTTKNYDRYLEKYTYDRHYLLNHQLSGVMANERDLKLFSQFLLEKQHLHINGDAILEFIAWARNERNNSAGSINRKISSIRCYINNLRFLQVKGADNLPVEYLSRAREPYPGPIDTLTPEEVKKLLNSVDKNSILGFRDHLLYSLLYRIGLRLGEALAINLDDIDFDQNVLTIHGKGRRRRKLPLLEDICDMLASWIKLRKVVFNAEDNQALFISKKGNRLAHRTAQENFKKIVVLSGSLSLDKVTPHSLRHAFATHAVEGNADIIVLKAIMGHARMESTQIYVHPSMKTLRRAVNDHIASDILREITGKGPTIYRMQQKYRKIE